MATRSHIIFEDENGDFHVRYHHWDGYPSQGLGEVLQNVFNTPQKIQDIFSLKYNFSSIVTSEKKHLQNIKEGYSEASDSDLVIHGQLVYDNGMPEQVYNAYKSLKEAINECNEEYYYYFKHSEQKWYVSAYDSEFFSLNDAIQLHYAGNLEFKMSRLESEIKEKHEDKTAVEKLEKKIPVFQNKIESYCYKAYKTLKKYQETMSHGDMKSIMYNRCAADIDFIEKNAQLYKIKKTYKKMQKDLPQSNNNKTKLKI